jgi:hypothetical protein
MIALRLRPRLVSAALFVGVAGATLAAPREARAIGGSPAPLALSKFGYNVCRFLGFGFWTCLKFAIRVDPVGDVSSVSTTLQYNTSRFSFNASESGPLGVFSVGGSAPPATPGVGTQPLPIFSSLQDTPGAPLPGSTLAVNDVGGVVSVNYTLASPINVPTETNFFLLVFDYVRPVTIDASRSTVTYSALTPGADFTETSLVCSSGDPLVPTCGSETPAMGITVNLTSVPEPSTLTLLASGLALAGGAVYRRRRRTA